MAKYIDADRLRAEIDKWVEAMADAVGDYSDGVRFVLEHFTFVLDSLQQDQPDEVLIPRWCLENIENTLRIQHNINNDAKDGETCQDRNIKESLNCVRKLLNGEEITGRERSEPLMKQPEVDLEIKKQIEELANDWHHKGFASDEDCPLCMQDLIDILWYFYELGFKAKK